MPRPTALPATDVPAPREVSGTPVSRATASAAATSSTSPRPHDGERRDAVERGVGGVHAPGARRRHGPRARPAPAHAPRQRRPRPWVTCYSWSGCRSPDGAPSLADAVVEAVRAGITAGELVPDETYSVYQLADLLDVSRSPVREALLRLAEAGLVQINRNRGFQVVLPRARDIEEIIEIRLALEPAAARRAAEHATDDRARRDPGRLDAMGAAAAAAATRRRGVVLARRPRPARPACCAPPATSRAAASSTGCAPRPRCSARPPRPPAGPWPRSTPSTSRSSPRSSAATAPAPSQPCAATSSTPAGCWRARSTGPRSRAPPRPRGVSRNAPNRGPTAGWGSLRTHIIISSAFRPTDREAL